MAYKSSSNTSLFRSNSNASNNNSTDRNNNLFNNGYYPSTVKTRQEIEEDYMCGICHSIIENAFRPNVCQHTFCKQCLYNSYFQSSTHSCPLCRKVFDYNKIQGVPKINTEIDRSYYMCESCDQKLPLSQYNHHYLICNDSFTPKTTSIVSNSSRSAPIRQNSTLNSSSSNAVRSSVRSGASATAASSSGSNRFTFKCPYCDEKNLSLAGLRGHVNERHVNEEEKQMVCPVCASMPWGDPSYKSVDFVTHLNLRHKFDYDYFVDFDMDDDTMLERAISDSLSSAMTSMGLGGQQKQNKAASARAF